jgi:hypothetical protein
MTKKNLGHGLSYSNAPDSANDLTEESFLQSMKELMKPECRLCFFPRYMHFTADTLKKYFGWTDEMVAAEFAEDGVTLPVPDER